MLLAGLLSGLCSVCFLIEPRTTCTWLVPPTVGWVLPHQPLIKIIPSTDLPTGQTHRGSFSTKISSSHIFLGLLSSWQKPPAQWAWESWCVVCSRHCRCSGWLNTLDAHVEGIAQQHLEPAVPSEDSAKLGNLVQNIQSHWVVEIFPWWLWVPG